MYARVWDGLGFCLSFAGWLAAAFIDWWNNNQISLISCLLLISPLVASRTPRRILTRRGEGVAV